MVGRTARWYSAAVSPTPSSAITMSGNHHWERVASPSQARLGLVKIAITRAKGERLRSSGGADGAASEASGTSMTTTSTGRGGWGHGSAGRYDRRSRRVNGGPDRRGKTRLPTLAEAREAEDKAARKRRASRIYGIRRSEER